MGNFEAMSDIIYPPLQPKKMWSPANPLASGIEQFRLYVNEKFGLALANYAELHGWSVDRISDFWETVWDYTLIIAPESYTQVIDEALPMDSIPEWFRDARLNYAENMLSRYETDDKIAIISTGEMRPLSRMTFQELYQAVQKTAAAMRAVGVSLGDRVAGCLPNCAEAVISMLATTSLGAIWSSTSPDFGVTGILDRFEQIRPKLFIGVNAVYYNGKVIETMSKIKAVVQGLPTLEKVILIRFVSEYPLNAFDISALAMTWDAFVSSGPVDERLVFQELPFNHPAFILFSSGTTGKPKCLVHSGGGMLIQHKKEHMLHGNLKDTDVFFQYTTTGWMMWNWLVSALSMGVTIVLYDGSPFKPGPDVLWHLVDNVSITAFGTSAKYIQSLQDADYHPRRHHNLSSLHSIYSTGSPLKPESFDYVYECISPNVLLGSVTGGTDICSLFAGHNSSLPVYRGEIQCRCLGMKVESWTAEATPFLGKSADLVCTKPFPAMPVYFWGDEGNVKYRSAYFEMYKGVWYQGDFVWINPHTGGVVMLGRSDGTLNPAGVRFGSAEIYNIVETFVEVADSLVVGQVIPNLMDERVVLFLKMRDGPAACSSALIDAIKKRLRNELSPRHVPSIIMPVEEIPYTVNGKKVEIAVKRIISNQPYVPSGTIANPDCLQAFAHIPALKL